MTAHRLVSLGLLASIALPASPAAAAAILGAEAAAPVSAWFRRLEGLRVESAQIQGSRVVVKLAGGCRLLLSHPSAPACSENRSVGNTLACFEGEACPDMEGRDRALAAAGDLSLPWREAEGDVAPTGDAADPNRAKLLQVRQEVGRFLETRAVDDARKAILPVLALEGVRPVEWLSILPLASAVGAGREAWGVVEREDLSSLDGGARVALAVTLLMGPDAGAAAGEIVVDAGNACPMMALATTFLTVRAPSAAGLLGAAARARDSGCFEAYAVEAEAWTRLRDWNRQKEVSEAALARFPDHPDIAHIEEPYLLASGKGKVVLERLEARLAEQVSKGAPEPGLLKELLSFYIEVDGRPERLAAFLAKADRDPQDAVSAFFAGVLLHYEKDYERSQRYLEPILPRFPDEPRLYIYVAMNAFNLGDQPTAEKYISKAAELDLRDPDVAYCTAEVFRDSDRKKALSAIETYLHMTEFTADARSVKQKRVQAMRDALRKCKEESTPAPCPGPFEHEFDSVRKKAERERQLREDSERVKGLKDLPDGKFDGGAAPGGPPPGMSPPPGWKPGDPPPPGWKPAGGRP